MCPGRQNEEAPNDILFFSFIFSTVLLKSFCLETGKAKALTNLKITWKRREITTPKVLYKADFLKHLKQILLSIIYFKLRTSELHTL